MREQLKTRLVGGLVVLMLLIAVVGMVTHHRTGGSDRVGANQQQVLLQKSGSVIALPLANKGEAQTAWHSRQVNIDDESQENTLEPSCINAQGQKSSCAQTVAVKAATAKAAVPAKRLAQKRENKAGAQAVLVAKTNSAKKVKRYQIRLATYSMFSNAKAMVERLKKNGFSPKMKRITRSGKTWYQVSIGPLRNLDQVHRQLQLVRAKWGLKGFVKLVG